MIGLTIAKRWKTMGALLAVLIAVLASSSGVLASVSPPSVTATLPPGGSTSVTKTVTTPTIPPNPEICFLADTTGSMGAALNNVVTNIGTIMSTVVAAQSTAKFCAAEYKDILSSPPDPFRYRLNQAVTSSQAAITAGIGNWLPASGGGDTPEAQLPALRDLATQGATGWSASPPATRIIAWFGDSNGHDPRAGVSLASAISALTGPPNVKVIAVPVTTGGNGLNNGGQANAIVNATGGSLVSATPGAVAAAILLGLQSLPVTVTPVAVGCAGLTVSFAPASQTVTSGNNAVFTETITVDNNPALQGTTINCTVDFQTGFGTQSISITIPDTTPPTLTLPPDATNEATSPAGAVHTFNATATDNSDPNPTVVCNPPSGSTFPLGMTTITCTATDASGNSTTGTFKKTVEDTIPPVPSCVPNNNPAGKEPKAPGKGDQGQNQDGFYQASASEDVVDPNPEVFVVDMGTDNAFGTPDDTTFGAFASPTNFKYIEANGATPSIKPGSGDVDFKIKGQGDAAVTAVDFSGNVSDPVFCLVPPPPK